MNEFIEKLIGRLEERIFSAELYNDEFDGKTIDNLICLGDVTEIVIELAEEYKLFGKTEQVKGGWIACERDLPKEDKKVL